jgi:SET family sugar efflux transporter-like MFS transporter
MRDVRLILRGVGMEGQARLRVFMVRRLMEKCGPLYREREFRVLLALNLLLGLAYSFVVPFLSMFGTREVGMSEWMFGVFMVITALSAIFFGTVLAHFSDTRYSRRAMLLLGSAAGALGYGGYAYLREVWALTLTGALLLGVASITFSQVFALARETINRMPGAAAQGAFYINACRMFFALAWTVGPAMAAWMMVAYSYEGLFLCGAGCFAAFFVVVWRWVPAGVRAVGGAKPPASPLREVLSRGDALAHFCGFVLLFASGTVGMMNLPLFTLEELEGTTKQVGIMYSVAPVFELPFMLYFGVLASRKDPARIIRLGGVNRGGVLWAAHAGAGAVACLSAADFGGGAGVGDVGRGDHVFPEISAGASGDGD